MEWIVAVIVAIVVVVVPLLWGFRKQKKLRSVSYKEASETAIRPKLVRKKPGVARLSASEILAQVQVLRDKDAQWDVIWSTLNPANDAEVQRLLVEIRGPHMFAPHLGLSVIEDGCNRVLATSPNADGVTALREAIHSQDPFVR